MGIVAGDRYGLNAAGTAILPNQSDARLHNSYTVNFGMAGTTDNGLSYGATFRLDMDGTNEENQAIAQDNGTAFISGSFGRLTLGDTDGALDWAVTETAMGGSIADDHTAHAGYNGNGGLDGSHDDQVLRYEYTFGDFGFAVSLEQANQGQGGTPRDDNMGIGARYSAAYGAGTFSFGLGYQTGDLYIDQGTRADGTPVTGAGGTTTAQGNANFATLNAGAYVDNTRHNGEYVGADVIALSAGYSLNGLDVRVSAMQWDVDAAFRDGTATGIDSVDHVGLGVGYTMDALTIAANWGQYDWNGVGAAGLDTQGYGVAVNYDLGGGAELQFGYGASDREAGFADTDSYSFGIAMSF